MRKLCFGGSFNPIHHGHLLCGMAAAEQLAFDRLVLIPSAIPPLKALSADMASAADRFGMCKLATEHVPGIEVSGIELERSTPSFTIDTARQLRQLGWGKVSWLIGSDAVAELPRWHDLQGLLREIDFVVIGRPGQIIDWQSLPAELRHLEQSLVIVPQIQISATEIRRRVRNNLAIDFLTPPPVCAYIHERGLYRVS
jgi:nicotinate-nucleotide adenylyltransferase